MKVYLREKPHKSILARELLGQEYLGEKPHESILAREAS
jgi:hypothetical protein